jgi:hypothetical protein
MTPKVPKERSLVRDVGLLVVGAIIAFVINQYGGALLSALRSSQPSLSAQLLSIKRHATSIGLYPVIRRAHLHGDGTESIIVESIFAYTLPGDNAANPQSDQIAIYDVHDEGGDARLDKRFVFSPVGVGGAVDTPSWRLSHLSVEDIADDGRQEIVGGFGEDRADDSDVRPFLISWDPVAGRYAIAALLPRPIPFARRAGLTERDREYRTLYDSGTTFSDPESHIAFHAYGTSRFTVAPAAVVPDAQFSPAQLVTVNGASTEATQQQEVQRRRFALEMDVYTIDARSTPPVLSFCGGSLVFGKGFPESGSASILHLLDEAPPESFEYPVCR